jgi:hypothetical protein
MNAPFCSWLAVTALATAAFAQAVKDRAGAVRHDREMMESDPRWIYNDYERGFAEARRLGKPLLVVLRCVPCQACAGIDASVLQDPSLAPLLDQFVCVRVINANALDLERFQFDYDLSFSAVLFNGDGTVYGRYGSWTHQKDPLDKTTAGFKRALEATLALHRGYPANKPALAGKQGGPTPFKTPLELPTLAGKYQRRLDWDGQLLQSCVHCHQIGDAFRAAYRKDAKPIPPQWVYPWPAPETIGLTLAPDATARVQSVAADSIAARAGLRAGDDLVSLDGQPLVSIADVSWVLHRAPEAGTLAALVTRGSEQTRVTLTLPPGWRTKSDISRRVGTWPMRAMVLGGLVLTDLSDAERAARGLSQDQLALRVQHVGQYGEHAAAKNAGFQADDLVVACDAWTTRLTESELIGRLLRARRPGEKIDVTVLRNGQRVELTLPMQ